MVSAVLRDAPTAVAAPEEEAAYALLANAVSPDLEERHLRDFLNDHTYGSGEGLRNEILDWLDNRIALASTNAYGLVDLARSRSKFTPQSPVTEFRLAPPLEVASPARADNAPLAPAGIPNRVKSPSAQQRGAVSTGKVTSINASGARIALAGGVQGWLHISKVRVLNGGVRVEDVADHLRVGQQVQVRHIGIKQRGQALLELADRGPVASSLDMPSAPQRDKGAPASGAVGPPKRFGLFRPRAPRTGNK